MSSFKSCVAECLDLAGNSGTMSTSVAAEPPATEPILDTSSMRENGVKLVARNSSNPESNSEKLLVELPGLVTPTPRTLAESALEGLSRRATMELATETRQQALPGMS